MRGIKKWIFASFETIIGFAMFIVAQSEISSNWRYTWTSPYTSYEAKVVCTKWIGILLLFFGIIDIVLWIGLKLCSTIYTNKHVQDINQLIHQEGNATCLNCGLSLTGDVKICPRCGKIVMKDDISNVECNANRYTVEVSLKTNNINEVLHIIAMTLKPAGYKQKIVDGEAVWVKGDGVITRMQCVGISFTDNSVFFQGWMKDAITGESNLNGFFATSLKKKLKGIIAEMHAIILSRNL